MKKRANHEGQTLENKIEVEIQQANQAIAQLRSSITGLKSTINSVAKDTGIKSLTGQINQAKKSSSEWSKTWSVMKKTINFSGIYLAGKQALSTLKEMTNASIDFTETTNLFEVSMGKVVNEYGNLDREASKYYLKASDFQDKLTEKLGINIEESMRYQALFNSMTKSMGLGANYAYILSENMTKLGYDLASLYNIDTESAMTKLRAGLAGQTEPLRELGLDITEQSLKPVAESLGITESIRNMSQAEKTVLRYIAVLRQAQIAQGDFARTMDSPANQLRIFNAQVTAFKRNMGNLWQGILGGILPYINAVMMVINELLKMVAKLFGFKVSNQSVNVSTSIGADDLASDLGTASDNAKKLKNQLMGFDEINNINLDNDTSSGGISGGSIGGIDQRLLDALKGYDNLMDSVSNKATEIKDKILEWLGFTEDVNGELKWSWDNMNDIAKILVTISGIVGGIYVIGKITKLVQGLKNLVKILRTGKGATTTFGLGIQSIGKFIGGLKDGFKNFSTWISMVVDQYKIFRNQGNGVITSLKKTNTQLKNTGQGFSSLFPQISKVVKIIGGTAGLIASNVLAYQSMEDLANGTISVEEGMGKLVTSIGGATVSGALLGSTFGPVGTVIGGLTGFVTSSTSAFIGYNTELRENANAIEENKKKYEETLATYESNIEAINKNKEAQLVSIQVAKEEIEQLESMIDSNGKVKDSYKERVEYILNDVNQALGTEYELTGDQISINGDLIGSYDELKDSVDEYIKKKEEQIELEAFQETYKEELKKQIELQKELKEAEENSSDAQREKNRLLEEGKNQTNLLGMAINGYQGLWADWNYNDAIKQENEIREELNKTSQSVKDAKENWVNCYTDISNTTEENMSKVEEVTTQTLINQTKTVEDLTPETVNAWINLARESENEYQEKLNETDEDTQLVLQTLLNNVDTTSPEYIEKWRKMASASQEKYNNALSTLPTDTQILIDTLTNTTELLSPQQIQKWADLARSDKTAYEDNLSGLDEITRQRVQSCVDAINNHQWSAEEAAKGLAIAVENGVNTIDTTESGRQVVNGVAEGINKNKNSWNLWDSLRGLKDVVVDGLKSLLGIHSPSTIMRDLVGKFIPLGIAKGIDEEAGSVYSSIDKINKGIRVRTNDFSVDTTQFVDYGQISGAIATQSNIDVEENMIDRIGQACYNAFINAMKTQGIRADIKVEPDKEGIFKSVQVQAEQFITQTGEEPFPSPA